MRRVLHILTTPPDGLVASILEYQKSGASNARIVVERVDLTSSASPDYDALLDKIFLADSVSTW